MRARVAIKLPRRKDAGLGEWRGRPASRMADSFFPPQSFIQQHALSLSLSLSPSPQSSRYNTYPHDDGIDDDYDDDDAAGSS